MIPAYSSPLFKFDDIKSVSLGGDTFNVGDPEKSPMLEKLNGFVSKNPFLWAVGLLIVTFTIHQLFLKK